jgi:hypothetical protein
MEMGGLANDPQWRRAITFDRWIGRTDGWREYDWYHTIRTRPYHSYPTIPFAPYIMKHGDRLTLLLVGG